MKQFGIEFLSIFIAVISAFALNNWNENRKASNSENKILIEIANGLEKDLEDLRLNKKGHGKGLRACNYFRKAIEGKDVDPDSAVVHYMQVTRDFISIQNTAGYETLKSRGLELVQDDSLRLEIISLYEYDYDILRKLEEDYAEMQFEASFNKAITKSLAPNFIFDENNVLVGMNLPIKMSKEDKQLFLIYLFKIQANRYFIKTYYNEIEEHVIAVRKFILEEVRD